MLTLDAEPDKLSDQRFAFGDPPPTRRAEPLGPPSEDGAGGRPATPSRLDRVLGRPTSIGSRQRVQRGTPTVSAAVETLRERIEPNAPVPADRPLFIFSAGWPSESTPLQRLIASSERSFLSEELYHQTDAIRGLAESLLPLATGWPPEEAVNRSAIEGNGDLPANWIANHHPLGSSLLNAHRAFLRELLAAPAPRPGPVWREGGQSVGRVRALSPAAVSRVPFHLCCPRPAHCLHLLSRASDMVRTLATVPGAYALGVRDRSGGVSPEASWTTSDH